MPEQPSTLGVDVVDGSLLSASAIHAVANLAQAASAVQLATINDVQFADRPLHRVDADALTPEPLAFWTLSGFASYVLAEEEKVLVHVQSPTRVEAVSTLQGAYRHRRRVIARALYEPVLVGFAFGTTFSLERLAIALQTCFATSVDLEPLRVFCSAVRSTAEVGVADDGVSQTVHAKRGVSAVQESAVRNPWRLAPFRTFPEVVPPESNYVLRFTEGDPPAVSLHEVGDGSWRLEAVHRIASYLQASLSGVPVLA